MKAKAKRIDTALRQRGLRSLVGAIDDNPATAGEVVLWIDGAGRPVQSVREAVRLATEAREYAEARYG